MKTKIVVLLGLFFATRLLATELTVLAAASLTDAMTEIAAAYEKESGDKIQFNFGASSLLQRQIEQGAPADLFISADEAKMDALDKKGLLAGGTRRDLLTNVLVIIVPDHSTMIPKSASDLTASPYKKLALAETKTVPAGVYAREYLQKLGLWDALKEKVISTENVRGALAAVESENAEAGFVYKTDALTSKKVKIAVEIQAAEGPKISYPVAVLKASSQPAGARKLEEYLSGPTTKKIFEKFGFTVLPPASR